MKKIVFMSVPAAGHINPTLAVVKELVRRKVKVLYYATSDFKEALESVGAEFRVYKSKRLHELNSESVKGMSQKQIATEVTVCGSDIMDNHLSEVEAEKPDCIVHDSMAAWAIAFVRVLNVPAVASITTFAFNGQVGGEMLKSSNLKNKLSFIGLFGAMLMPNKKMGDAISKFTGGESRSGRNLITLSTGLNLVYTSSGLQPYSDSFNETYRFIGPSICERNELLDIPHDDRPLIYISIGTVIYNPKYFKTAIKAYGDGRYRVLLSIGSDMGGDIMKDLPDNFIVKKHVPQLEVLKKAALFVSHCGMNSAHEALYYGVPIIGLPQSAEQSLVASIIEKRGAGVYLRAMTATALRITTDRIIEDPSYRESCRIIRDQFEEAGGARKAAHEIMKFAEM